MRQLDFEIRDWQAGADDDPASDATQAALTIVAGPDRVALTAVEDTIVRSVRPYIFVPVYPLARWLVVHWWRLRWEPKRETRAWRRAHSLAAIGSGYAWPSLEISSDGEFVQLHVDPEDRSDVAAIRYFREATLDVPVADFEAAVDQFVQQVQGRLSQVAPEEQALAELWAELQEERADEWVARECRWQALAGFEPGRAPSVWLDAASDLATNEGPAVADEVVAVVPELPDGFLSVVDTLQALRGSRARVDLSWLPTPTRASQKGELPWQTGERLAHEVRASIGQPNGPLATKTLADLLGVKLPLRPTNPTGVRALGGGYRNGHADGRTAVTVASTRLESQRFHLSRVMASALQAPCDQHLLPVTSAATARQKTERAFAQELLCPWVELDAYTNAHGVDDDGIADAAEYFEVSPLLVVSTLVNKRKVGRGRLA